MAGKVKFTKYGCELRIGFCGCGSRSKWNKWGGGEQNDLNPKNEILHERQNTYTYFH